MNYRLSLQAEADLIAVYLEGIEHFGAQQAEVYLDQVEYAIALIGDNPEMARLRDEITPPVRVHPVEAHIVVYLIDDNGIVRILRIRHGRENWTELPIG